MTLLDMYHYDKNVLSPISSYNYKYFSGTDLVNYLLTTFSLTLCGYNEPTLFAEMCSNFITVHDMDIKRIVDSLEISSNIDIEHFSYNRKIDGVGSGSGNGESRVSAFNSSDYQPDTNSTTNTSYKDNRAEAYNENVKANEVLNSIERRLRLCKTNVYGIVAGWFADELLICVW